MMDDGENPRVFGRDGCNSDDDQRKKDTECQTRSISLSNQGLCTDDLCRMISSNNDKNEEQFTLLPLSLPLCPSFGAIVRLDLSRNKLTSLPKELFVVGGAMLEFLDVGRNGIKELPIEIGHCKHLKTLIALSNKLRFAGFPVDAVLSLQQLEKLDLRWNKKMNTESSRKRLLELFPPARKVKLILNHTEDDPNALAGVQKKKLSACDRDANELRSQLEPLSTPQLRKRLCQTFGIRFDDSDETAYDREAIMQLLLRCYHSRCDQDGNPLKTLRSIRYDRGVAITPSLYNELLYELNAIRWPRTTRERPKIAAEGYIILQRPQSALVGGDTTARPNEGNNNKGRREAEKLKRFHGIWTKAVEAIESVDPVFAQQFTALAVTKNFKGSPHIDTLNVAPFYGVALGDFCDGGGYLCVECSPTCVAHIDTRGRFAKVDGRFCHWVSDYEGTRYSLIYYVTHGRVVPQTTATFQPSNIGEVGERKEEPSLPSTPAVD